MRRVVMAIASLQRGAIEPAEWLSEADQAMAIERLDAEEGIAAERVVWHRGKAYVSQGSGLPDMCERLPRISHDLRRSMSGREIELGSVFNNTRRKRVAGRV